MLRLKQNVSTLLLLSLFFVPAIVFGQKKKTDSLLQVLSEVKLDSAKIKVLLQLSVELKRSEPSKAIVYATQALTLSEINSDSKNRARATNLLGDIYRIETNYGKAKEYYSKAYDIYETLNDSTGMSSSSNYIGMMYGNQGLYSEAIKYYFESLKINQKKGDKTAIAISYNNIGNINDLLGNYSEALKFHFKSLQLKEEIKNEPGIANTLNNIGEIYKKLGDYDKAMNFYTRSLLLKKKIKFVPGIANTLNNIGDVYSLKKEYYEALDYYTESLKLLNELDDKEGKAIVNNNLGILYTKISQPELAVACLQKGLSLSTEIGLLEEQCKSYLALSGVYESKGNYKLANEYFKQNALIKDSLLNNKNNKLISEMQAKYEHEENQRAIALLTKEKDFQQLELYNNKVFTISVSIGCILLLVLVFSILYAFKQKQKANLLLISQNADITRQKEEKELLLKEIHHRVKNNLQIINSLLRLQSHQLEDEKSIALFEECQNRILSMAIIHERLYKSDDLAKIDTTGYIETLSASLVRSYRTNKEVEIKVNCTVKNVGIDTLMPLGLILNELISNSLKYGFIGRNHGKISIDLHISSEGTYEMLVSDNGIGLPENFSWENSNTLGLELVKTLVDQIEGTIEKVAGSGTAFRIRFRDIG